MLSWTVSWGARRGRLDGCPVKMQQGGSVTRSLVAGAVLLVVAATAGCAGGKNAKGPVASPDGHVRRSTKLELEGCPPEGAVAYDADSDGKPEVLVKKSGDKEVCRVADIDTDGRPDRVTYFDGDGRVRRIESDFDRDGRVDEIALLEAGVVREKQRATTLNGKLDTWEFYKDGRVEHTERDKNGDGVIDQWWEYVTPSCPLIHSDGDGDGRPDPATTIDYCKVTGYVPPEEVKAHQAATSHDFVPTAPPTEVREISNVSESESRASGTSSGQVGPNPPSGAK
jgi:hypothetical protein